MNIITDPRVELVSRQTVSFSSLDKFLAVNGYKWERDGYAQEGELLAEAAGRLCYMSYEKPRPGGNTAYLRHIKEVGHGSVLEHVVYSFFLSGISRSLTHELVRHRAGTAFSQLSQRYVDESVAEYVVPGIINADEELFKDWCHTIEQVHAGYVRLSDALTVRMAEPQFAAKWCNGSQDTTARRKTARQAARSVLPNATETKMALTLNARALRHVIEQRGHESADPEIRRLAVALFYQAVCADPNLFNDYTLVPLPDGTAAVRTDYRKV